MRLVTLATSNNMVNHDNLLSQVQKQLRERPEKIKVKKQFYPMSEATFAEAIKIVKTTIKEL